MKVTARLNYLRISPRKVRAVVDVVKKMEPREAALQLKFIPNRASQPLIKLIRSALANAENNFSLDTNNIKIAEFKVDGGPAFKRFRPGSRGRVSPLRKRTSHITLVLEGQRTKKVSDKQGKKKIEPVKVPMEAVPDAKHREARQGFDLKQKIRDKGLGFVRKIFQRKSV